MLLSTRQQVVYCNAIHTKEHLQGGPEDRKTGLFLRVDYFAAFKGKRRVICQKCLNLAFLPLTVAKLSTVKNSRFLAYPVHMVVRRPHWCHMAYYTAAK